MENSTTKTAAFHTLGCKLNFAETSTIARQLTSAGYEKVSFDDKANVYVINTCSVTENADRECKLHVKRAMKANPEGLVAVSYTHLDVYKRQSRFGVKNIPFWMRF